MIMTDLDPKLTFDTFVIGPANRLASAAAKRSADAPGTSYNPLFIYSASGLGKTHILSAVPPPGPKGDAPPPGPSPTPEGRPLEPAPAPLSGCARAHGQRH